MLLNCKWKNKSLSIILLPLFILCAQSVFAENANVYIKNVDINNQGLIIKFSGKAAYQTVQVDESQVLIALKEIRPEFGLKESVDKSGFIKRISFDKMAGDVTALVVYTSKGIKTCNSTWLDSENSLSVNFVKI